MISGHYLVSASETNDSNHKGYKEEKFKKDSWKRFVSDTDTGYTAGEQICLSGYCVCFSEISNGDMQSCQENLQNAYEEYLGNYISVPLEEVENNIKRLKEEWGKKNRILIYGKVGSDKSIWDIIQEVLECVVGDCSEIQKYKIKSQTILDMLIRFVEEGSSDDIVNGVYSELNMTIKKTNEALGNKLSELGGHIRFLFYIEKQRYHNIHGGKEILPEKLNAKIFCVRNIILGELENINEVLVHILSMYREQDIDKNSNPEKEVEKDQNIYKSNESLLVEIAQLIQDREKEVILRKIIKDIHAKEFHALEEYNEEYHINEQGGIEDVR